MNTWHSDKILAIIFIAATFTSGDDEEDKQKDAQVATSKVREDVGKGDDDVDQHQGERSKLNCQTHDVLYFDLAAINLQSRFGTN